MLEGVDVNSQTADLADELAIALKSPVEIGQFCTTCVEPGGETIPDPELTLQLVLPLIEATMLATVTVGTAFDHLPDNLSFSLYGAHELWPLLLHLNKATTRSEFVGPTFTVVKQSSTGLMMDALRMARAVGASRLSAGQMVYGDLTLRKVPAP